MLSLLLLTVKGFSGPWYIYLIRYVILFSYIIPISLRVNLDMGKVVYSWMIQRDKAIPHTLVRSSTIPEELGRIEYLLSDKTGTLTQNKMVFRKLHLGSVSYSQDSMSEVATQLRQAFPPQSSETFVTLPPSSPTSIALVKWTESVGVALVGRDLTSMHLQLPNGHSLSYEILQLFPFTSESKRMGIIVRDTSTGVITFYMKGADAVMGSIVQYNDWLDEECGNMAREGLRTLVVGKRVLTEEQYTGFEARYKQAKLRVTDRATQVSAVVQSLEENLELLCVTGVEDQLQHDVRPTLELLRNAGIRVWMLTGDKLETATSIALSSRLISRSQTIFTFKQVSTRSEVHSELNSFRRKNDCALIISGDSLELCLQHYESEFIELVCQSPAVVCCRCSPTHKAQVVKLLRTHTKKLVCAIGDGGNDVSMIQAANVGIGIVGKEGKQASLAADFSITQFQHISRLLVWHGRNR